MTSNIQTKTNLIQNCRKFDRFENNNDCKQHLSTFTKTNQGKFVKNQVIIMGHFIKHLAK